VAGDDADKAVWVYVTFDQPQRWPQVRHRHPRAGPRRRGR
jgi:hypothetical protein